MKKIVYLPLDERPCNAYFPQLLFCQSGFELISPDASLLGRKKIAADFDGLKSFLLQKTNTADALVLSVDTLLYGGIVPSRLHYLDEQEIKRRLQLLKQLKKQNEQLKIYAFSLIMRCPQYSSADEEPDYYETVGRNIFLSGELEHKIELGLSTDIELLSQYKQQTGAYLKDYLDRRKINLGANLQVLQLCEQNIIDFLLIPQDDSSVYGYTAKDQAIIREQIKQKNLQDRVYMFPGADEAGMTMIMRTINNFLNKSPKVFVFYAAQNAPNIVPLYEDRPLDQTVNYQILSCGAERCDSLESADIVLAINCGGTKMFNIGEAQLAACVDTGQNLEMFCDQISNFVKKKPVMLADVAFCNGSDQRLLAILNKQGLLSKLASYAGWNTASNTLGTALAQGLLYLIAGQTDSHIDFLALRYVEDGGYCGYVRKKICDLYLADKGFNYFDVKEPRGEIAALAKSELQEYVANNINSFEHTIVIEDCFMPWSRMFEVGLRVRTMRK